MAAGPIRRPKRQDRVNAASAAGAAEIPAGVASGLGVGADDPAPSPPCRDFPARHVAVGAPGFYHFSPEQGDKLARWLDREATWAMRCIRFGMKPPCPSDRRDRPWRALISPVVLEAMDVCETVGLWTPPADLAPPVDWTPMAEDGA